MTSMFVARKQLTLLWFIGVLPAFVLFLLQTMNNLYQGNTDGAWGWLLPNILPTLSIISSTWLVEGKNLNVENSQVNTFVFRLALSLSFFYLLILTLGIVALGAVLDSPSTIEPLDWLQQSNLWLAPIQGIVVGLLGVFFINTQKPEDNKS